MWMPWDPEAYKTGRVEYMEEELNQLMSEKTKNESNAKSAFEQRVKESKQKAKSFVLMLFLFPNLMNSFHSLRGTITFILQIYWN